MMGQYCSEQQKSCVQKSLTVNQRHFMIAFNGSDNVQRNEDVDDWFFIPRCVADKNTSLRRNKKTN